MKPLWLKIEGLRSYRDPVEIDFGWLGGSGLFGICGPTGAGKSTVLDAMFLALYGDVPRNNTASEFLHPEAAAALVELTFAVTRAGTVETWRVRREWRRVKKRGQAELSQEVSAPRVELHRRGSGGWELVHDRARDVSLEITDRIVGIPMEDFRRAIVLPQGEFDRLLRAAPKDRAQLLGRVFGLGRFGAPLQAAAKTRRQALDLELHELQARLQAKTETAGNVEALEAELAKAKSAALAARAALAAAEAAAVRSREGRKAAEALEKATGEVVAVRALAADAEANRRTLEAATRAERAWPNVEAWERATVREADERRQRDELAVALARAEDELASRTAALAEAERALAEEAPKLEARLQNAREALRDKEEADAREREASLAGGELRALELALEALVKRRAERDRRQAEAEGLLAKAEAELQSTRVPAEERRRVDAMVAAVAELEGLERDLARASEELSLRETAFAREHESRGAAEHALAAAVREREAVLADPALALDLDALARHGQEQASRAEQAKSLGENLARAEDDLVAAGGREAEAMARLAAAEQSVAAAAQARDDAALGAARAEEHRNRAEIAKSEALRSAQAAHLAEFLAPGHPCPVCGSAEHPQPARSSLDLHGPRLELESAEQYLAQARVKLADAVASYERARSACDAATDALAERRGERQRAQERLDALRATGAAIPEMPWAGTREERQRALAGIEAALVELRERYKREQKAQKEAEKKRQQAEVAEATARQRLASSQEAVTAREAEVARARALRAGAMQAVEARRPALAAVLDGKQAAEVRAEQRALAARDESTEKLEAAVRRQRELLDAVAREGRADEQERETKEAGRAAVAAKVAEVDRRLSELRARIRTLAEGRDPSELIEALSRERDRAADRRRQAEGLAASAREVAAASRSRHADATRRAEESGVQLERAKAAAAQAIVETGFASAEECRAARRTEAERVPMERVVRDYDERVAGAEALFAAAQAEAARVGELPTAEAARAVDAQHAVARDALEQALAQESRAAGLLETARQAANEGAQVRGEIDRLSPRLGRLAQLEKLLQGEKMVGFAADRHLQRILAAATGHLRILSSDRYELVRDPEGAFAVRDRHQAGTLRPASTLSGGESFLVSLALALALSDHLQSQGSVRFDFFFLDEGFGSLDEETLQTALDALERLRGLQRTIGTISHVPAMHERLPRRLVVQKALPGGSASVRLDPAPG